MALFLGGVALHFDSHESWIISSTGVSTHHPRKIRTKKLRAPKICPPALLGMNQSTVGGLSFSGWLQNFFRFVFGCLGCIHDKSNRKSRKKETQLTKGIIPRNSISPRIQWDETFFLILLLLFAALFFLKDWKFGYRFPPKAVEVQTKIPPLCESCAILGESEEAGINSLG